MSNFNLKSFSDPDTLARVAAKDWLDELAAKPPAPYLVALSGGRIAKNFFRAVTDLSRAAKISLRHVEFFWVDERCVPPDDPESNYLLASENLLQPLGIAVEKIHRLKGELPPAAAVTEANSTIQGLTSKNSAGTPVLDLIFLGLGENGHVASLMPNATPSVANAQGPYLHIDNSPKPPPNRLSMSYAVLAGARSVWMLASGAGKEDALRSSLHIDGSTPFNRVLLSRDFTTIYSDITY